MPLDAQRRYGAAVRVWDYVALWQFVADELRSYRRDGLAGLLTEDTVRFATAKALVRAGISPDRLRTEWPHPVIKRSRIDLIIANAAPEAFLEFKYPREPSEKNAAWTMTLGEILKDLYRLAVCPGEVDRLFVYVETERLRRYMSSAAGRYGLNIHLDEVNLRPEDAATLPTTAAQIIGAELAAYHVTARRRVVAEVDHDLRLAVYDVDPLGAEASLAARIVAEDIEPEVVDGPGASYPEGPAGASAELPVGGPTSYGGTRDGARSEILAAVRAVLVRSGRRLFTPAEIVTEMNRCGTGYAESTIRTMITSHMCSNAPDHAGTTYDDFERTGRGLYRLTDGKL